MTKTSQSNKRLAKNTIVLYIRMIVMMIISFYTTRVILNALGVDDYGINNVVGSLVSMFSLISSSLSGSTSRFITFELGKGDKEKLRKTFITSVNINIILAIVVVIAIETVGVWFLNNKMVIPADRLYAANWVLQCSVIGFAIGLLSVPYNASIIAHEKMSAFAYMTIFDAIAKLCIALVIDYYNGDKLILFAIISLIPTIISQIIYYIYCKRKFEECRYRLAWEKNIFKEIGSFALWTYIGCTAGLIKDQGVNIAINLFCGPAVNAARGIAMQINGVISRFISNFTIALNPQVIKEYAAGNLERMYNLIFKGARFSYYLFMFLSIPVFLEIETILQLWLGKIPTGSILFARLVLILSLAEIISHTLIVAQSASGKVKNYQIVVGGILLLNFPVSYYLLSKNIFPESTVIVAIVISQICLLIRLLFLRSIVKLSIREFIKKVYLNVIIVTILSFIPPFVIYYFMSNSLLRCITTFVISVISSAIVIYFMGCDKQERILITKQFKKIINRLHTQRND